MASLPHDMTVVLDTSQLDQIVRVTCFADCENQEKKTATCNLKRIFVGASGVCMRYYEKRTGRVSEIIKAAVNA